MKLLIIFSIFFSMSAQAFILVSRTYRLSKPEDTEVKVSSEGCTGNGISDSALESAISKSVAMWNDVPESRLRLSVGSKSATSVTSSTIAAGDVIVGRGALGAGIGGVTQFDQANGSARITLNSTYFVAGNYVEDALVGTIIHELGHAIGLNHSKDKASVMTY